MPKDKAQTAVRLAVANEKARTELELILDKWFRKYFVKGITLPQAKGMHSTGTFSTFEEVLQKQEDQIVIAVVRKLDPRCIEVLSRPRPELVAHIRALASGAMKPTGKPKPQKKPKVPSPSKPRKPGGVLANARQ